ncbi:DNA-binding protein [Pseudomonas frederiksbergensis]|nr:DNA-binding protein [Pseudomonas frederiksbergensis]
MEQLRQLFSVNRAAETLDLSRSKLYELMKHGQLRFVMIGADRRIPADEIARIAAEGIPRITKDARSAELI